jgi:cell division protein FtsB
MKQPCDCKVCLKAQNEALRAENESLKAKIDELCDQLNIYVNGSETEEEL